jgi:hypothetical protein
MTTMETSRQDVLNLRVGELVEVRSENEILATLDEKGELEALPFMPEMRQFCGQRLRVHKRAAKLCHTISGTGIHRMENAVHLAGVRCDGQAHGGCQAGMPDLLERGLAQAGGRGRAGGDRRGGRPAQRCTVERLMEATRKDEVRYSCQATELLRAAPTRLPPGTSGSTCSTSRPVTSACSPRSAE